jgi:peptidoglycan/xylan/chitin deacetylase (PgdA/CDA1 family)
MFAGEVGVPRLLKLFEKYNMKTTWFVRDPRKSSPQGEHARVDHKRLQIPGHSLDTFPEEMAKVRDAGHEIGLHGYSHEVNLSCCYVFKPHVLEVTDPRRALRTLFL